MTDNIDKNTIGSTLKHAQSKDNRGGYRLIEVIGAGSYGEVWKAEKDGTYFAIKTVLIGENGVSQIREIDIVKRCQHPNIIQFRDIFVDISVDIDSDERAIYYVMALADGTMDSYIYVSSDKLRIMFEIISAILFLHTNNICHGDLKPANILMFGNKAVITDFGLSQYLDSDTICTPTPHYAPPEILSIYVPEFNVSNSAEYVMELREEITDMRIVDVWSLGAIFGYVLTGKDLFFNENNTKVGISRKVGRYIKDPDTYLKNNGVDDIYIPVLKRLLDPHPSTRLSDLTKILSLPMFAGIAHVSSQEELQSLKPVFGSFGTIITFGSYNNTLDTKRFDAAIKWIGDICKHGLSSKSYFRIIDLFYRCFDLVYDKKKRIKRDVIIPACILIACKLDNNQIVNVDKICRWCDKFTTEDLISMETDIIIKLSGILYTNTPYSYCSSAKSIYTLMPLVKCKDFYINTNFKEYVTKLEKCIL